MTLIRELAVAVLFLAFSATVQAQPRPAFEVASVKLNTNCAKNRGPNVRPTPGRLNLSCMSVRRLVSLAYGGFADGAIRLARPDVVEGPSWVDSQLYDIEAKASTPASFEQIHGVMLQGLLEERFKVEVRREFRETPVYLMAVARSGPKFVAAKGGNCVPEDPYGGPPNLARTARVICGRVREMSNSERIIVDGNDLTISDIAGQILARYLERPIIDKTGLAGKFDVHLELAPALMPAHIPRGQVQLNGVDVGTLATPADDTATSVFSFAEQQLGLKLSAGKGPVEFLVITHAERPSAN